MRNTVLLKIGLKGSFHGASGESAIDSFTIAKALVVFYIPVGTFMASG